jgi:hypothetical protein
MGDMAKVDARVGAVQVGEFAVGVAIAYTAIGLAWTLSGAPWAMLLAAAVVVAAGVLVELRFGSKATGLFVGLVPTSLFAAALLGALSLVAYRLN